LGARISAPGIVQDVVTGSPAAAAGIVPGMKIVGVDNRTYSAAGLTAAVERAARTKAPIVLLVDDRQTFATLTLAYSGGVKLPSLARASNAGHDYLADIVRARTPPAPDRTAR
jgi:predicted metalloprotease with PDZ domain